MSEPTKASFYKSLIDIQKSSGQGLSGIVRMNSDYSKWMDEFIEEGLVSCSDTGGSIGHPESNKFYMPTQGYNVWEDNEDNTSRFKGKYLHYVRLFLGQYEECNATKVLQDPDSMRSYTKWLTRNKEQLDIMMNLSDVYVEKDPQWSEKEVEWIKSKDWYKENQTVTTCIKEMNEVLGNEEKQVKILKELIELYKQIDDNKKIEESKKELEDIVSDVALRNKVINFLKNQKPRTKINKIF